MNYLPAVQVLFIHARLIGETGGANGLRDLGLLEAAAVAQGMLTTDQIAAWFVQHTAVPEQPLKAEGRAP